MKKIILTLITGIAAVSFAEAQSIERSVIGAAGGVSVTPSSIITWTVGETVVNTASGASVILTQGFQQPEIPASAVKPINQLKGISIYPNPSSGIFTIEAKEMALKTIPMDIEVRDGAGKLVFSKAKLSMANGTNALDLTSLPGGFYSLTLQSGENLSTTYKLTIIK